MSETEHKIDAYVYRLPLESRPFELCVQELSEQADGFTSHRHEDFGMTEAELRKLQKAIDDVLHSPRAATTHTIPTRS